MTRDEYFMTLALREAEAAAAEEETPIGAVVVRGDEVIAAAHNGREWSLDITAHAELSAIRAAERAMGDWRLSDCTLYVTLEPCPMCAGGILASRIGRVVYGAKDPVAGAMGSVLNLPRYPLGTRPEVVPLVLEEECRTLLQQFFKERRK
ncbi:MAG: nucleoside deaminase [Ruminococcaceae bacterium]|nr:nucleoside deaminase [Oscillospiraceae bacterium]